MGFFSDLKDDLSQAVNELMPEEELEAALAEQAGAEEMSSVENVIQDETPMAEDTLGSMDLSSMLDKLEEAPAEAVEPQLEAEPEPIMDEVPVEAESIVEEMPITEPEPVAVIEEMPEAE